MLNAVFNTYSKTLLKNMNVLSIEYGRKKIIKLRVHI